MVNWNNLIVDILIPNHEVTRKFLMLYRKDGFKRQAIIKVLLAITLNSKLGSKWRISLLIVRRLVSLLLQPLV